MSDHSRDKESNLRIKRLSHAKKAKKLLELWFSSTKSFIISMKFLACQKLVSFYQNPLKQQSHVAFESCSAPALRDTFHLCLLYLSSTVCERSDKAGNAALAAVTPPQMFRVCDLWDPPWDLMIQMMITPSGLSSILETSRFSSYKVTDVTEHPSVITGHLPLLAHLHRHWSK